VIESPPPAPGVSHVDDPLDTDPFLEHPREQALRAAVPRPDVTISGDAYSLPCDDAPVLREFVTTLYLVHGWKGVRDVRDQLQRMVDLKLHPGRPAPAGLGPATRERVAGTPLRGVEQWAWAYQDATRLLAGDVLDVAVRLEEVATTIVQAMLADSQTRVVDETIALFRWKDRETAKGVLGGALLTPALEPGPGLDDLRQRMTRLRPAAAALERARDRAREDADHLGLWKQEIGEPPPELLDKLAGLQDASTKRDAEFSAALLGEAPPRPVLFRLGLSVLTAERQGGLAQDVFKPLKRTWEATVRLSGRFGRRRPARNADRRALYDGATPESLIAADSEDSVWAFPKVLRAARAQMPPQHELMADRMLEELETETARHAKAEMRAGIASGLGLAALTLALTAVCPPAGIALDMALSAPDVFSSFEEYEKQTDDAVSDLDPRASLSDAEPSVAPVVLSVAGALLSAA
jgi:hypothetical protein